jgi:hypothetical protein
MKIRGGTGTILLYSGVAAGLALFATVSVQTQRSTVLDHGLKVQGPGWIVFPAVAAAAFAVFVFGIGALARIETRMLGAGLADRLKADREMLIPALFLLLAPLLTVHYWTRSDLRARLVILGLAVLAAVLYVRLVSIVPLIRAGGGKLGALTDRFRSIPVKRRLLLLFFAAFLAYNLSALVLVSEGVTFSGDEPSYLMTTDSLYSDHDINLADNYGRQAWFNFYDRSRAPDIVLFPYTREGRKGPGHQYPINLPGISFLMLPWYGVSRLFRGRALTFILKSSLAVWAALLGTQVYLLVRQRFKREGLALGVWAVTAFTAPVLFYATHLYPELPIALMSVYIFRRLTAEDPPTGRQVLFLGLLLATFLWFGVKYNFVFGSLVLVGCHALGFRHKAWKRVPLFLAPAAAGAALFYGTVYALYGTFSPMVIYEGIQTPEYSRALMQSILAYPLSMRLDSFFDYFLDQRDGLLLYAPVYIFALLGLVAAVRRRRSDFWYALLVAGPFLLNYAFFTHRQGVCPQGRVLAPLIWIGALMLAYFLDGTPKRVFRAGFGAAAAASAAIAALLHAHPDFLYQTTTHEVTERAGALFVHLSNMRVFLPPLLPSFLKFPVQDYPPNTWWIAGLALFVALYALFGARGKSRPKPWGARTHVGIACGFVAVVFLCWAWLPRVVLYPTWTSDYPVRTKLGFYLGPTGSGVITRENGRFYLHEFRPHRFVFAAERKLDRLKIAFGSETEDFETKVRFFDLPLTEGATSREIREFTFEPAAAYPFRGRYLYEIGIDIVRRSPKKEIVEPYYFQIAPTR